MGTTFRLAELAGVPSGSYRLDTAEGSDSPADDLSLTEPVLLVRQGQQPAPVKSSSGRTVLYAKRLGVPAPVPVTLVADAPVQEASPLATQAAVDAAAAAAAPSGGTSVASIPAAPDELTLEISNSVALPSHSNSVIVWDTLNGITDPESNGFLQLPSGGMYAVRGEIDYSGVAEGEQIRALVGGDLAPVGGNWHTQGADHSWDSIYLNGILVTSDGHVDIEVHHIGAGDPANIDYANLSFRLLFPVAES